MFGVVGKESTESSRPKCSCGAIAGVTPGYHNYDYVTDILNNKNIKLCHRCYFKLEERDARMPRTAELERIAKGLIVLGSDSVYWDKAREEERQMAKKLYNEGWRPKNFLFM